jgi:F-type H+-transporting ATPase subunit delta
MRSKKANSKIIKGYTKALFESSEPNQLEQVNNKLMLLAEVWSSNSELVELISDPAIQSEKKLLSLRIFLEVCGLNPSQPIDEVDKRLVSFVNLVFENGRLAILPEISTRFTLMFERLKHILRLEIKTAYPVEEAQIAKLTEAVEARLGVKPIISTTVDPNIIGGMIVTSGDKLYDLSIRGGLERARSILSV